MKGSGSPVGLRPEGYVEAWRGWREVGDLTPKSPLLEERGRHAVSGVRFWQIDATDKQIDGLVYELGVYPAEVGTHQANDKPLSISLSSPRMDRVAPYHFLLTSRSPTGSIPILHFAFLFPDSPLPPLDLGRIFFYREICASRRDTP